MDYDKHLMVLCPKCEEFKIFTNFHVSKSTKTGSYWCCKGCRKTMDAKRYQRKRRSRFLDEVSDVFDKYGAFHSSSMAQIIATAYNMGAD